ncbi:hypothetical protein ZHAS_00005020 [Anopheles sinensis]|uniref:Uncharacterized protein n=1 Tax=Anopheles sinensis TaxID=74873 RepID=A0A084VIB8_ANOSI|nr:hypothetical protein ZHAS_00005020 [Anopheles sinensis]
MMENPDVGAVVQMAKVKLDDLPEGLVLVSSGDEGGPQEEAEEDEQEEGEIQDDEDDDVEPENGPVGAGQAIQQLELEDISSEEESNIRERMAALEAMDKEVGLIHQISSRSAYDYLNSRDGMYGKENYFHYYEPRQQQRYSNTNHKSAKITAAKKQDNRREAASKHERIVAHKRHLEKTKEKTKRCSHKKHKKRKHVLSSPSPERHLVSSDSEPEATVDREYLKIACATENVHKGDTGHASKNPLKRKLLLMTPRTREKSKRRASVPAEKRNNVVQMLEEEEELQLRLLALRTKPIVNELIPDLPDVPSPPPPPSLDTTPEDELPSEEHVPFGPENHVTEEQKLRLIALKSAYLKKHETRLRRKEQDAERPYSPGDDLMLSPVREVPPVYDELDNDLYSVGKASVEVVDDDNDVEIIETPCELIALDDTEDEDGEEGGKDMEISSVDSPTVRQPLNEDSQQPIDMELASSEQSSEPFPESLRSDIRPHSMLLMGVDSCDSELFTRRDKPPAQSPPMTPDSMEEAEAEALRHFLLTKMRQKQSQKTTVEEPVPMEETTVEEDSAVVTVQSQKDESTLQDEPEEETFEQMPDESSSLSAPAEEVSERMEEQEFPPVESSTLPRTSAQVASQTVNSNLITLVNRTNSARKRRKKSQTIKSTGGIDSETAPSVFPSASKALAISATLPSAARPEPSKVASTVRTQKLVNNPNKLINLNQTISPSPPLLARTESPTIVDSFTSKPVAKLVIQVGHSDSDSDVDFGSPTPNGEGVETVGIAQTPAVVPNNTARFEEQLDRFLKSVRSKASNTASNGAENTKDGDHSGSGSKGVGVSTPKQQQARGSANRTQAVANATVTSSVR